MQTILKSSLTFIASILLLAMFLLTGLKLLMTPRTMEALGITPAAIHYINDELTRAEFAQTNNGHIKFTQAEVKHFDDVKNLMNYVEPTLIGFIFLFMLALWRFPQHISTAALWAVYLAGALTLTILCIKAFGGWKPLTTFLHNIAFPNGNWKFSSASLTIQLYPRWLMQFGLSFCFFFALACLFGLHFWLKDARMFK